jgi:hypothetical protein
MALKKGDESSIAKMHIPALHTLSAYTDKKDTYRAENGHSNLLCVHIGLDILQEESKSNVKRSRHEGDCNDDAMWGTIKFPCGSLYV